MIKALGLKKSRAFFDPTPTRDFKSVFCIFIFSLPPLQHSYNKLNIKSLKGGSEVTAVTAKVQNPAKNQQKPSHFYTSRQLSNISLGGKGSIVGMYHAFPSVGNSGYTASTIHSLWRGMLGEW